MKSAWIPLPEDAVVRASMPPGHPYDFGFLPAMTPLADGVGLVLDAETRRASETGTKLRRPST
jgi:hypothetical protein